MLGILVTMVVLTAAVFHCIPLLVRPTIFFGVTVPHAFLNRDAARSILRRYRLTVWLNCLPALAVVWLGVSQANPLLLIAGTTWQVVSGLLIFQWARRKTQPHAARRLPEGPPTAIPRWMPAWWFWLGPFVILGATALYLNQHWLEIPDRFPVHWNASGEPDRWADRTPGAVFMPLAVAAAVLVSLIVCAYGINRWSRSTASSAADAAATADQKNKTIVILLIASYFMALLFAWIGMQRLSDTPVLSPVFMAFMLAVPLVGTIAVLLVGHNVTHSPAGTQAAGDGTDDRYWRGGVFYVNRADPAIFVPKRLGFGWTLNFGNPAAWLVLIMMLFLPLLPLLLR